MLTLETSRPSAGACPGLVHIDVTSHVVRLALSYIAEDNGWTLCTNHSTHCPCVRIVDNDRRRAHDRAEIVVVRDTPKDCQDALDAILAGTARAVVLWDEPETLQDAIIAAGNGAALIPGRVLQLAHDAPRISARQRRTLKLVAAGRSNREIAGALHQSLSTTKRDIAELMHVLDAANRAALTTTAARLGYL